MGVDVGNILRRGSFWFAGEDVILQIINEAEEWELWKGNNSSWIGWIVEDCVLNVTHQIE